MIDDSADPRRRAVNSDLLVWAVVLSCKSVSAERQVRQTQQAGSSKASPRPGKKEANGIYVPCFSSQN